MVRMMATPLEGDFQCVNLSKVERKRALIISRNTVEATKLAVEFEANDWIADCSGDRVEGLLKLARYPVNVVIAECDADLNDADDLIMRLKEKNPEPMCILLLVDSPLDPAEALLLGCEAVFTRPIDAGAVFIVARRLLLDFPEERIKRTIDRIPCDFPVVLRHKGTDKIISSRITNLGYSGMFIVQGAGKMPKKFESFSFAFRIEPDNIEVTGKGLVRWIKSIGNKESEIGFGIEFFLIDGKGSELIHKWVHPRVPKNKGESVF